MRAMIRARTRLKTGQPLAAGFSLSAIPLFVVRNSPGRARGCHAVAVMSWPTAALAGARQVFAYRAPGRGRLAALQAALRQAKPPKGETAMKFPISLALAGVLAAGAVLSSPVPARADGGLITGLIIGGIAGHVITRHHGEHFDRHYWRHRRAPSFPVAGVPAATFPGATASTVPTTTTTTPGSAIPGMFASAVRPIGAEAGAQPARHQDGSSRICSAVVRAMPITRAHSTMESRSASSMRPSALATSAIERMTRRLPSSLRTSAMDSR